MMSVTSDTNGQFAFADVPPGKLDLFVDGRTAIIQNQQFPALHFEVTAIAGEDNRLPRLQ